MNVKQENTGASLPYLGCELYSEHYLEMENMILGGIFIEPELIHQLTLEPIHFASVRNQIIFQAMRELQHSGLSVDLVTLVGKLGDKVQFIGGVSYLSDLASCCPTTANLDYYQSIVLEEYKIRELKRCAIDFMKEGRLEAAEKFYQTYMKMQEIGRQEAEEKEKVIVEVFEELYQDKGELSGYDTGFSALNKMTGGWNEGDLIIMAARPSMGKTAFALSLAMNVCRNGGVADIFSLEMPQKQLVKRMLSNMTGIHGSKWKNPYRLFSESDQERAQMALEVYYKWKMQIHDHSRQTVSDIRAAIQKTRRENPDIPYVVVIDYLQLITITGRFDRHDLAIGHMTKELKQVARQYNVPIILLSQLSRSVEQRQDKRPLMSDLRDSGSIEQDADLIMLLYRDEYYSRSSDTGSIIEIQLAKHRNGPVGTIELLFEKEFSRFADV